MADIQQVFNSIPHRYKDIGGGAYAEVVAIDGGVTIDSVSVGNIEIANDVGNPIPTITGLQIPQHDRVELGYTGEDLTQVVYKLAGSVVTTLQLTYTSGKLVAIAKA
jgi:hypothetical protein